MQSRHRDQSISPRAELELVDFSDRVVRRPLYAFDAQVTKSSKAFAITARDALVQVDQFDMVTVWYFDRDARLVLVS